MCGGLGFWGWGLNLEYLQKAKIVGLPATSLTAAHLEIEEILMDFLDRISQRSSDILPAIPLNNRLTIPPPTASRDF